MLVARKMEKIEELKMYKINIKDLQEIRWKSEKREIDRKNYRG